MIKSRRDYLEYRQQDQTLGFSWKGCLFDDIRRFKILLRKAEYHTNCGAGVPGQLLSFYYKYRLNRYGRKLGFSIGVNVVGPGVSLPHRGTIVINSNARLGKNCRIHVCVNIGASGGTSEAPQIGNNVYIAPGAKIYGAITIADGIAIGANAVVKDSFQEPGVTIGGVPARKLSDGGSVKAGWGVEH
jgi:serine O-acetyltransferase